MPIRLPRAKLDACPVLNDTTGDSILPPDFNHVVHRSSGDSVRGSGGREIVAVPGILGDAGAFDQDAGTLPVHSLLITGDVLFNLP